MTDPLRAALRANRVNHAYLFSGPRGCGKTTSARILARCLNCAEGPTDTPCGQCDSCRELATGGPGSLDVVEIDAASHGGVDDARDLRERATFAPVRDRYKVFIIDEAHMVSPQGFNALLKLVEEPPEHVKFVFATTEPERVIGTIRSRTHHYPFRLVPPDVLEPYLHQLCEEEQIRMGDGVLPLVMRAGGGSVRDSLSVLDQLMAGAIDGEVAYSTAVALLGYTDTALLDASVDALAGGDGAASYRVIEKMVSSGHDPRRFVEDFLQRLRDLLIIAVAGDGAADVLVGTPVDQMERMQVQARNWGSASLSRAADLADEALRSMTGATSPRLQLELLVGRILVPAPAAASPAEAPSLPGSVGMVGGGAPRSAEVAGSFGAREARERLARERREREQRQSTPGAAPAAPASPGASAPAAAFAPSFGEEHSGVQPGSVPGEGSWPTRVPGGGERSRETAPSVPVHEPAAPVTAAPVPRVIETPVAPQGGEHAPSVNAAPAVPSAQPQTPVESAGHSPASTGGGREADLLRQRWGDVVERLSSISRVAWSLVAQNGQLGAVDGHQVVLLFPVAGMVAGFMNGGRAQAVEKAIHEVVGLQVQVVAQTGQAGGGTPVTAPSAQASHPEAAPRVPAPLSATGEGYDWRQQEPPPFDPSAHGETPREDSGSHAPASATPSLAQEVQGWPTVAVPESPEPETLPEGAALTESHTEVPDLRVNHPFLQGEGGAAGVRAQNDGEQHSAAASEAEGATPDDLAQWNTASPGEETALDEVNHRGIASFVDRAAARNAGLTALTDADEYEHPEENVPAVALRDFSAVDADAYDVPAPAALSVTSTESDAPNGASLAAEPVATQPTDTPFMDAPVDEDYPYPPFSEEQQDDVPSPLQETPPSPSWEPVAIPGGHAAPVFDADTEEADADPFTQRPTGRERAMTGAGNDAEPDSDPYASLTAPADDDTASIDDADMDTSTRYGIPAVLEILGGQIIEQVEETQGGW